MADTVQTDEYGQPILDENGDPFTIADTAASVQAPISYTPGAAPSYEFGRGIGVLSPQAAVVAPRNRTYIGPMVGDSNDSPQQFFQHNPKLANRMPPPPSISPDQQAALQGRLSANPEMDQYRARVLAARAVDTPGAHTIGFSNPPMPDPIDEVVKMAQRLNVPLKQATDAYQAAMAFQAMSARQAAYKAGIDRGLSTTQAAAEADAQYGLAAAGGRRATYGQTLNQQIQSDLRKTQLEQENEIAKARLDYNKGKVTIDPVLGREKLETEKALNKLNADIVSGKTSSRLKSNGKPDPKWPIVEAELNRLQKKLDDINRASPSYSTTPSTTGTTPAPVAAPRVAPPSTGGSKIRMRNPQGKVGTLPSSQVDDAVAAGWSRL